MDLLTKIMECQEEEVDEIISQEIKQKNQENQKIERLGFLSGIESRPLFKGFIPLTARIKYANINMEDYSMKTTDFMYEFAHFLRQYNINNKGAYIYNLEYFINDYFGFPHSGKQTREEILNPWETTTTDEEYFEALENNEIGNLKGKGAAECTERAALAQQVLSLFGSEVYYCIGCVDLGTRQEPHAFNIIKRQQDYALLDYSCPISSFNQDKKLQALYPFIGTMSKEEFAEFSRTGKIKDFENYEMINRKKVSTPGKRLYVVGALSINKEQYQENQKKETENTNRELEEMLQQGNNQTNIIDNPSLSNSIKTQK